MAPMFCDEGVSCLCGGSQAAPRLLVDISCGGTGVMDWGLRVAAFASRMLIWVSGSWQSWGELGSKMGKGSGSSKGSAE